MIIAGLRKTKFSRELPTIIVQTCPFLKRRAWGSKGIFFKMKVECKYM
jgi:hypothetical protein